MGLLATALLVANLAFQPVNPPKNVTDLQNAPYPQIVTLKTMVVVTIDDQGKTYINKNSIDLEQLLSAIKQQHAQEPKTVFVVNASRRTSLLEIGKIIHITQSEGVEPLLASMPDSSSKPLGIPSSKPLGIIDARNNPVDYCSLPTKSPTNIPNSNPKVDSLGKTLMSESFTVVIDDAGKSYLDQKPVDPIELSLAIKQQHDQKPETVFRINAASKASYGDAGQVMDIMRSSGVNNMILNIVLLNNQPSISLPINMPNIPSTPCPAPLMLP
jgi:biopolymer transport protein ExbD